MTCTACHERPGTHEATDGTAICDECLALACKSPKERASLAAQGRKAARDAAHANLGIPTEQRARESAERMAAAGVAWLDKIPTPFKVCGHKGKFLQVVPQDQAIVDFVGHDAEGRIVAVEVKSISAADARFYLRDVRPQQRAYLDHVAATGGSGFLLVDFITTGTWYLLPWGVVRSWTRVAPEDPMTRLFAADREQFLVAGGAA